MISLQSNIIKHNKEIKAGEMSQQLRALPYVPESLTSAPSTQLRWFTQTCDFSSRLTPSCRL